MKKRKNPLTIKKALIGGALVGLLAALLAFFNLLAGLELRSIDLRFFLRGERPAAHELLIVGVTESCLQELGRWPWERELHAELIGILNDAGTAVIAIDFIFTEPSPSAEHDRALVNATEAARAVVYATDAPPAASAYPGFLSPRRLTQPLPALLEQAEAGFINVTPDLDGIMRRALLWMEHDGRPISSFSLLTWGLWQDAEPQAFYEHLEESFSPGQDLLVLGGTSYELDRGGRTLINYSGGPGHYPVLPYHMVIEEAYHPSTFRDKIVLVGFYAPGLGDYYFTPIKGDTPMYGVELHANILQMLIDENPISSLPLAFTLVIVFLAGLLPALIYRALHPVAGFAFLLVSGTAYFYLLLYLFAVHAIYVEAVYPLTAMGASYVGSLAYRFTAERRDRHKVTRIFGRYVSPQVVDDILDRGDKELELKGTRRLVTAFFIDIRGFTALAETLPPEEVVAVLNRFYDIVTRCIFNNHGTIDKFMGDAVMAIFNAPLPLNDHSLWALRAAADIIGEGETMRRELQESMGITLDYGIGINCGEAVVGNVGSEKRMEYTAIGDTVNLAARLEAQAGPGEVLVSEAVSLSVAGRAPLEPHGELMLKGKSEPVKTYRLNFEGAFK